MQVIKDNYATFAVPYNGEDNNDYVDGKGFCCNDGSLEVAQVQALARAAKNNFQEGDTYYSPKNMRAYTIKKKK